MGNVVQHGEAVADNGRQFQIQPVLYNLGQVGAVQLVGLGVGHGFHFFLGPRNGGRMQLVPVGNRLKGFHLFTDLVGVGHHHLVGPFLAQVGEFFQHFIGGPQV